MNLENKLSFKLFLGIILLFCITGAWRACDDLFFYYTLEKTEGIVVDFWAETIEVREYKSHKTYYIQALNVAYNIDNQIFREHYADFNSYDFINPKEKVLVLYDKQNPSRSYLYSPFDVSKLEELWLLLLLFSGFFLFSLIFVSLYNRYF